MAKENRKLLLELADLVLDAQEQTTHYISLDFSNFGWDVSVRVKLGGFTLEREYDLCLYIDRSDTEKIKQAIGYIRALIAETPGAATPGESK